MLGLISPSPWRWAAFGKHPAARDYVSVGETDPLLNAFSKWVDDGYCSLNRTTPGEIFAWRFWAKGPKKNTLVCGIARDSNDSLGRPYPILVIGAGPLRKWEKNWGHLPEVCDPVWDQMEKLALRGVGKNLKWLDSRIRHIKPPEELPHLGRRARARLSPDPLSGKRRRGADAILNKLSERTEVVVPLSGDASEQPFDIACMWHRLLMQRLKHPPNSIFMGGLPERPQLVVFRSPLAPKSFMALWSQQIL